MSLNKNTGHRKDRGIHQQNPFTVIQPLSISIQTALTKQLISVNVSRYINLYLDPYYHKPTHGCWKSQPNYHHAEMQNTDKTKTPTAMPSLPLSHNRKYLLPIHRKQEPTPCFSIGLLTREVQEASSSILGARQYLTWPMSAILYSTTVKEQMSQIRSVRHQETKPHSTY